MAYLDSQKRNRRNEYKKKPSHQDLVMWEKCEAMLHESEGDVLVVSHS
jgi:hypothetical protein